jgi:hypothetical protein
MINKDNPHIYKHFIDQLREAYQILTNKYPLPIDLFFVKAFLLGRTIELILKTELILNGYPSSELQKKDIGGHDLIKLLKLNGFPSKYLISSTTYDSIQHLNIFYSDKKYEYPQSEDVEIKNVRFLEEFINLSTKRLRYKLAKENIK